MAVHEDQAVDAIVEDLHLLAQVARLGPGLRRDDSVYVIFEMAVNNAFGFFSLGHVDILDGGIGTATQALHPMRYACFAGYTWWRRKLIQLSHTTMRIGS